MAKLPSVSVLVLNYNGMEHLEACFRSLQALDYPTEQVELVLVDNGSSDDSIAWMQEHFPTVRVIPHNRNWGFCRGYNLAVAQVDREIVAFLNNDMRVKKDWLQELVRPFTRDNEIAAVGSKILDWNGKRIDFADAGLNFYGYGYQVGYGRRDDGKFDMERPLIFVCGGAMAVRRDVFEKVGGFDEDFFSYYEDVDLCWRLWVLGYKVWFAPRSVAYHRHHGTSKQLVREKKRLLYERNALYTMFKNLEEDNLYRVLPAALLLLLQRAYLETWVDKDAYRPESCAASPVAPKGLPSTGKCFTLKYYLHQAWHTLRREGLDALWNRICAELRWRSGGALGRQLLGRRVRPSRDMIRVPREAFGYLLAGDDLIRNLPRLMEKRALIQAARRRPDAEIFPLFQMPLELSYFTPNYQAAQEILVRLWEIDRLFESERIG